MPSSRATDRSVLLEVSTVGEPVVRLDGQPISFATRHATGALLWLCVAVGARVPVSEMASELWPTAAESRLPRRMATMTWQIRRALGEAAALVIRTPDALRIDPSLVAVDLLEARWAARAAIAAGRPLPDDVAEILAAPHCTPFADMAWVAELTARNAELLAS